MSVATAGEIGISSLGSPLNNGMLASARGKSLKTYLLPSLEAVYLKRSSLDLDRRLSTIEYLDEASFSSESSLRCDLCTYPYLGLSRGIRLLRHEAYGKE